jgi:hypothetical protein
MDPTTVGCPHGHCRARGHPGLGPSGIHAPQEQHCRCPACHTTFSARTGTVCSRRRPAAETVGLVGPVRAHGCPLPAIVAAGGGAARTGAAWWARSGHQGPAGPAGRGERPRARGQGQAEALRVTQPGGSVGLARAMRGTTRLWRGGAVRAPRDRTWSRGLLERGRRGAARRPRLLWTAGVVSYRRALRERLRDPGHTGPGRTAPAASLAPRLAGPSGQTRRAAAGGRDGTPWARGHARTRRDAPTPGARGRGDADGVEGAAARDVPRTPGAPGAPWPGAGASPPDAARGEVLGRDDRSRVHAACESVPRAAAHAGQGGWPHRALLAAGRTAVVSGAAVSLGTTDAARTPCTGTAPPDQALVLVTTVNCGATSQQAPKSATPILSLEEALGAHGTARLTYDGLARSP